MINPEHLPGTYFYLNYDQNLSIYIPGNFLDFNKKEKSNVYKYKYENQIMKEESIKVVKHPFSTFEENFSLFIHAQQSVGGRIAYLHKDDDSRT